MAIDDATYRDWVARFDTLTPEETEAARLFAARLDGPTFDVVMAVYNPPEAFLRGALASVRGQIYERFTLCIADDGSTAPYVRPMLEEAAREDPRIVLHFQAENGGIARATNAAIALGQGEFVAFVDHDDVIPPHALLVMAHRCAAAPAANLLYSDFDFLDERGERTRPFFRPDYDPTLHLALNLPSSLVVYRRTLLERLGGMREQFPGSEDYDLSLRAAEAVPEGTILHVPHVLYHWTIVQTSSSRARMERAVDSARRAVKEHCERRNLAVTIGGTPRSLIWNRVRREPSHALSVTVIVWGDTEEEVRRGANRCFRRTEYPAIAFSQLVVGEGNSVAPAWNAAVAGIETELVAFVEARLAPRDRDWLTEMAGHFSAEDCAVVGARTIGEDGRIEQCGMLLGVNDGVGDLGVGRAFHGLPETSPSSFGWDEMAREVSCVAGGAIVARKSALLALSGFDESLSDAPASEVDICLAARKHGLRVVFCPLATFLGAGPVSRAGTGAAERLRAKWGTALDEDPYYSPNLTRDTPDFGLAFPPRSVLPWRSGPS